MFFAPLLQACRSPAQSKPDQARIWELEDENAQLKEQVAQLEHALRRTIAEGPWIFSQEVSDICPEYPPLDAVVLAVQGQSVVLNRGKEHGVERGFVFDVYRGSTYRGQVRVEEVLETTCRAAILHENSPMSTGDSATTVL